MSGSSTHRTSVIALLALAAAFLAILAAQYATRMSPASAPSATGELAEQGWSWDDTGG
jgi:hypothetical protein